MEEAIMYPLIPIILAYNKPKLLQKCLDSLNAQQEIEFICIVDNNAIPEVKHILKKRGIVMNPIEGNEDFNIRVETNTVSGKNYIYIGLSQNIGTAGFTKAISFLVSNTDFDYFYLLDDDTYLEKNCFCEFKNYFYKEDCIASLELADGVYTVRGVGYLGDVENSFPKPTALKLEDVDNTHYVTFKTNTGLCISRNLVNSVGYIREDFFFKYEDTEYCIRIKRSGRKIKLIKSSVIYHPYVKVTVPLSLILLHIRNGIGTFIIHSNIDENKKKKLARLLISRITKSLKLTFNYFNVEQLTYSLLNIKPSSTKYLISNTFYSKIIWYGTLPNKRCHIPMPPQLENQKFIVFGSTSFTRELSKYTGFQGGIYFEKPTEFNTIPIQALLEDRTLYNIVVQFHEEYIFNLFSYLILSDNHEIFEKIYFLPIIYSGNLMQL